MLDPKLPAFRYTRKSRHLGDPDDPLLLEAHRAILDRLALDDGLLIPPERCFEDVGSGERMADRPQFSALLDQLRQRKGAVLYAMEYDRLSRGSMLEQALLQGVLIEGEVLLRFPSGLLDLTDPDQGVMAELKGVLSRHEIEVFKRRLAAIRAEKNRKAEPVTGTVPYGYTWTRGHLTPEPDPDQFPILVACCREILTTSVKRLARRYGVPASTLQKALHSPVICGWTAHRYTTGQRASGRVVSVALPRREWVWSERSGDWPAACTRAEWEQIQAVLAARYTRPEWTIREDGWCRDVIRFLTDAAGGNAKETAMDPAASAKYWVRLQWRGCRPVYQSVSRAGDDGPYVRRDLANAAVTAALGRLMAHPERLAQALQEHQARQAAAATPVAADHLRVEIETRRAELDRAVRRSLAATDPEEAQSLLRVQAALKGEIRERVRALGAAGSKPASPVPSPALVVELLDLAADFETDWETLDGAARRPIVTALVAALPVRVTRAPGSTHWQREILPVQWPDWLKETMADDC